MSAKPPSAHKRSASLKMGAGKTASKRTNGVKTEKLKRRPPEFDDSGAIEVMGKIINERRYFEGRQNDISLDDLDLAAEIRTALDFMDIGRRVDQDKASLTKHQLNAAVDRIRRSIRADPEVLQTAIQRAAMSPPGKPSLLALPPLPSVANEAKVIEDLVQARNWVTQLTAALLPQKYAPEPVDHEERDIRRKMFDHARAIIAAVEKEREKAAKTRAG